MKPYAIICSDGFINSAEFSSKMWLFSGAANEFHVRMGSAESELITEYSKGTKLKLHQYTGHELLCGIDVLMVFWDGKPGDTADIMKESMQSGICTIVIPVMRYQ